MTAGFLQTVRGRVPIATLGLILPHEHLFVDLRGSQAPGYAQADPQTVWLALQPYLDAAYAAGVTAFVDCAPVGVGRNVTVLAHIASLTPIHIVAPTGIYRDAFIMPELRDLSAEALAERWIIELTEGMEGTRIPAGFIKIAMSDDGPTPLEVRSLKAAAIASRETGAVIGSHTIGGAAARRELDILEAEGLDLGRFIWIHTQSEPDVAIHLEAARRGAYVEYDAIGAPYQSQPAMVEAVLALLEAGFGERILLSHDAGWYDPAHPAGLPRPEGIWGYTALIEQFLPALAARGVSDADLRLMTVTNPARAFAM